MEGTRGRQVKQQAGVHPVILCDWDGEMRLVRTTVGMVMEELANSLAAKYQRPVSDVRVSRIEYEEAGRLFPLASDEDLAMALEICRGRMELRVSSPPESSVAFAASPDIAHSPAGVAESPALPKDARTSGFCSPPIGGGCDEEVSLVGGRSANSRRADGSSSARQHQPGRMEDAAINGQDVGKVPQAQEGDVKLEASLVSPSPTKQPDWEAFASDARTCEHVLSSSSPSPPVQQDVPIADHEEPPSFADAASDAMAEDSPDALLCGNREVSTRRLSGANANTQAVDRRPSVSLERPSKRRQTEASNGHPTTTSWTFVNQSSTTTSWTFVNSSSTYFLEQSRIATAASAREPVAVQASMSSNAASISAAVTSSLSGTAASAAAERIRTSSAPQHVQQLMVSVLIRVASAKFQEIPPEKVLSRVIFWPTLPVTAVGGNKLSLNTRKANRLDLLQKPHSCRQVMAAMDAGLQVPLHALLALFHLGLVELAYPSDYEARAAEIPGQSMDEEQAKRHRALNGVAELKRLRDEETGNNLFTEVSNPDLRGTFALRLLSALG